MAHRRDHYRRILWVLRSEIEARGGKAAQEPSANPDRDKIEQALKRALGDEFAAQQAQLLDLLGDPPRYQDIPPDFWKEWDARFTSAIQPVLQSLYVERAIQMSESLGIGVNWDLVNRGAADWAKRYSYDLVKGIEDTTRSLLQNSIESFYANGLTRQALEDLIAAGFTPARAEMIAVTEVTRASSQGEIAVSRDLAEYGINMQPYWSTNNDELVCKICGPLNNKPAAGQNGQEPYWIHPNGKQFGPPPAHPNCRCWVNLRLPK